MKRFVSDRAHVNSAYDVGDCSLAFKGISYPQPTDAKQQRTNGTSKTHTVPLDDCLASHSTPVLKSYLEVVERRRVVEW